jgi:NAD-dependent deacetylase
LSPQEQHQLARQWIREARKITILTGAGVSADSGLPTFRGPGGVWRKHRAEQLATPEGFAADPRLVWEWYDWRRSVIAAAQPNAAHYAIAEFQSRVPAVTLITQNVDGLHDRAGSTDVAKLHGDIWILRCTVCRNERVDPTVPLPVLPPICSCGGVCRPGVVWFHEPLPAAVWNRAQEASCACDLFLVAGTSAIVYPAASLAPIARRSGARIIEVNLEETPASAEAGLALRGRAAEVLPALLT